MIKILRWNVFKHFSIILHCVSSGYLNDKVRKYQQNHAKLLWLKYKSLTFNSKIHILSKMFKQKTESTKFSQISIFLSA